MNNLELTKALQSPAIPQELEPENVEKMLVEQNAIKRRQNMKSRRRVICTLAACLLLTVCVTKFMPDKSGNELVKIPISSNVPNEDVIVQNEKVSGYVNGVKNYEELYKSIKATYIQQQIKSNGGLLGWLFDGVKQYNKSADTAVNSVAEETNKSDIQTDVTASQESVESKHSETITQVEGVDEADIVKTDGKNVYYTANGKLYCVAVNDGMFGELFTYDLITADKYNLDGYFEGMFYYGNTCEMFLTDNKLTVVFDGQTNSGRLTAVNVYEINGGELKLVSEYSQNGVYSDSRMIGNFLYIITNDTRNISAMTDEKDLDDYVPSYTCQNEKCYVPAEDILVPDTFGTNYRQFSYGVVAGIDIANPAQPVSVKALADYSGQIYCSQQNLYVTANVSSSSVNTSRTELEIAPVRRGGQQTSITRIELNDGQVTPAASGVVDGTVLNQFSMDEYNGNFRIATTATGYIGENNTWEESNGVYVLNQALEQIGSITRFGKSESIKSVNFSGAIGYVVTYEQTDPLFAIDFTDPTKPVMLDEFKINGYSTYMYNWSDTLLLGFGADANSEGRETGVKLVMFDVSNNNDLKECGFISIGDNLSGTSYTGSVALNERKALFISPENNLIGVPVTVTRYAGEYDEKNAVVSGYIFYSYIDGKFVKQGEISQVSDSGYIEEFNRAVFIDDEIYAFSSYELISADMKTLTKISDIMLR